MKLLTALCLVVVPAVAWAQDVANDRPVPLSPDQKAEQLWTYGAVIVAALAFGGWYWLRRLQIARSGRPVAGGQGEDE